ncbi:hypothetical protein [Janthinobacterium lividum]|uniref:hypothetical protein n=1 Tax=Janthinobacterium lividum TaxID=29581 RepID=UPI000FE1B380|nr:hypothetical protein [Janthinobacterium lividum]
MKSKIYVEEVLVEKKDELEVVVLKCKILIGDINAGMDINVPFGDGVDMTVPVDEVGEAGDGFCTISINCDDQGDVEFLIGMGLDKQILTVE